MLRISLILLYITLKVASWDIWYYLNPAAYLPNSMPTSFSQTSSDPVSNAHLSVERGGLSDFSVEMSPNHYYTDHTHTDHKLGGKLNKLQATRIDEVTITWMEWYYEP